MRMWRVLRALVVGYFVLFGLGAGFSGVLSGKGFLFAPALALFAIAGFAFFMFQLAIGAFQKTTERVQATLEQIKQNLLDANAGPVHDQWDPKVARKIFGARITGSSFTNVGQGLSVQGASKGAEWQFASYVTPTRNPPMYLVDSYVRVDLQGANAPFRITHEGFLNRIGASLRLLEDVQVGDEAFDKAFRLDGAPDLLREVLDDPMRRTLLALRDAAKEVSFMGFDLEIVEGSLVLHWPGELNPAFAESLRNVLLPLRARLLEVLNRQAATGVRVGGAFRSTNDGNEEVATTQSEEHQRAKE